VLLTFCKVTKLAAVPSCLGGEGFRDKAKKSQVVYTA